MKVANITLHAIDNYGSVLQTLATERIFEQLGCEVLTIDYVRETAQMNSVWKILKARNLSFVQKGKSLISYLFFRDNERSRILNNFRKEYLHLTDKRFLSDNELKDGYPEADIYCTGSDQTWNVVCQGGVPRPFFLDFAPAGTKKIAFAASFGIETIPEIFQSEVKELLSHYDAISVREQTGVDILHKLGFDATLVLDPTLAVDPLFWHEFASPRLYNEDYILAYQLGRNLSFTKYMKDLADYHNLKLIHVRTRQDTKINNGECLTAPSPQDFLSLIKYAKYVITDSFHCTAYSIMFNRNFVNIMPARFTSRIEDILKITGLTDRILHNYNDFKLCENPIDYKPIDIWLKKEREKTISFLKNAISI